MSTVVPRAVPAAPTSPRAPLARARAFAVALGAGLLVASSAVGCMAGEDEPGERSLSGSTPVPIAAAGGWKVLPHFDDPAFEGPGPKVTCGEDAVRAEDGVVEVAADGCNFATLTQRTLADVEAGDTIVLRAWWGPLDAPGPATGRLSLFLGFSELWQETVGIPGPADERELRLVSPVAARAGTMLLFRVHNQGSNDWRLSEVSVIKK
ncbi:MAG TPA: hypothetical protein VFS00_26600 [Polyangiaceae bacterium]|nr:hypothetical protein [Polyangiaceae bacterium]